MELIIDLHDAFSKIDICHKIFNTQDDNGNTILIYAVINNNISLIKEILKYIIDVSIKNIKEYSALKLALKTNNYDIFKLLLDNGASPNELYYSGESNTFILTEAICFSNDDRYFNELINHGVNIHLKNYNRFTFLDIAIIENNYKIVKKIIKIRN
jgi:ankyrin repeat protein